jgi:pimeloyl-ACP methyl ester carboxylesterase
MTARRRQRLAPTLCYTLCFAATLFGASAPPAATAATASAYTCVNDATQQIVGSQTPAGSTAVLFVHGISSGPGMWDQGTDSIGKQVAAIPGATAWTFDYSGASLDWVTDKRIGERLAVAISCLARDSGNKIAIVAHSMGGLATQYALSFSDPYGGKVADHVAEVITIGTPFDGSLALSEFQAGVTVSDSPGLDALLSACAGISAFDNSFRPCGLASVARSPVGFALMYDSSAIAALPAWPQGLPVLPMAGNISEKVGVGTLSFTWSLGDVPVTQGSAVAHDTGGTPIVVPCPDVDIWTLIWHSDQVPCFHNSLPQYPTIIAAVVSAVSELVAPEPPSAAPPAAVPCPGTAPASAPSGWTPLANTTITAGADPGGICVSSPALYWGGIYRSDVASADYTVSADGRLANGKGWGLAARTTIAADGTVTGHAIQYDPGAGGYRDVDYPDDSGPTTQASTDNGWHHLTITVQSMQYTERVDGTIVARGQLPQEAENAGGALVRLWEGGSVELLNLTVSPGAQ